jgi:integrase
MNKRYRLFQKGSRGGIFYAVDKSTGKRESLKTKDRDAAEQIIEARNAAERQPAINVQIARAYLAASDVEITKRTWRKVMVEMAKQKTGNTLDRWNRAMASEDFDMIREVALLETRSEHFLAVLAKGGVATNVFLRRLHNFALDMTWLPWPVLPKKQWPPVRYSPKRAITPDEHRRIIDIEWDPERKAFYQLLWHLGGSQSDVALLLAEDIDWPNRLISYSRCKTTTPVLFHFGDHVKALLKSLPHAGQLFPRISRMHEKHRAAEFKRRCLRLKITGVTLHSYRYAWAQRAKQAGYPERFAQEALGHNSKAVHRAYARQAQVKVPSLEEFEQTTRSSVMASSH